MLRRIVLGLVVALLSPGAPAQSGAGQASASFTVSVQINTPGGATVSGSTTAGNSAGTGSGTCGSSTGDAVATVGCTGGAASTPLRVMAFVNRDAGPALTSFDVYTGGGTIAGWRLVSVDDSDYLEMTLGW